MQSFHHPQRCITLPAPIYDNTLRVLPAKEAHPNFHIQSFYGGLICRHDWLNNYLHGLAQSPAHILPRSQSDITWSKEPTMTNRDTPGRKLQGFRGCLRETGDKGQMCLWAEAKFFITQSYLPIPKRTDH